MVLNPPSDLHPHLPKHTPAHWNQDVEEERLRQASLYSFLRSHSNSLSAFQSDLVTLLVGPDEEKFTAHQEVVTKARYFAGCLDSTLQESHTNIIKLPVKQNFASAFKSDFVTVYVGLDKQKYTPRKDILTPVKFFAACLDSGFRESKENEISLPEEEPAVFERILEYLYHAGIDIEVFGRMGTSDSEYVKRKDQTTVFMAKVWVAADKYCMEECQNHVMDFFLEYLSISWSSPKIVSEISKRGMRECMLRKLIMEDLAASLLGHGSYWEKGIKDDDIMKLVDAGGIDAHDFFKTCVAWVGTGRIRRATDEHCKWHVHKTTKKCHIPADEDE